MKTLYDTDFNAWLDEQISLIRKKDFNHLDIDHLLEEMETLGGSFKNALEGHMIIALIHMLKQKYQPDLSSKSWQDSIDNAQVQIENILQDNPSLKKYPATVLSYCYQKARRHAARQTGLEEKKFPKQCPWKIEELLGSLTA
jgi:Domain of unknown function DUF29